MQVDQRQATLVHKFADRVLRQFVVVVQVAEHRASFGELQNYQYFVSFLNPVVKLNNVGVFELGVENDFVFYVELVLVADFAQIDLWVI